MKSRLPDRLLVALLVSLAMCGCVHKDELRQDAHATVVATSEQHATAEKDQQSDELVVLKRTEAPDRTTTTTETFYPPEPAQPAVPGKPPAPTRPPALKSRQVVVTENGQVVVERDTAKHLAVEARAEVQLVQATSTVTDTHLDHTAATDVARPWWLTWMALALAGVAVFLVVRFTFLGELLGRVFRKATP